MKANSVRTVAQYIAAQPASVRPVLRQVRAIIRKAVPEAVEVVSYGIAAFRVRAGIVLYLAGWRRHYSLYPASDALVAAFKGRLEEHRVSKGTLRFSLAEPVPTRLIERVAKFRAREVANRAKASVAARKDPRRRTSPTT